MRRVEPVFALLGNLVLVSIQLLEQFGRFLTFNVRLLPLYFATPFRWREFFKQIEVIGIRSIGVIFLTGMFLGFVQAMQLYQGFHKFGAENLMGYTTYLAIGREVGPVFTALMITSRAISAMAAELGTMRVTEQIDAIDILAIDSRQYLVVPRILATIVAVPILVGVFDAVSNYSAYLIATLALDVSSGAYTSTISQYAEIADFMTGIVKGLFFGWLIGMIGAYAGYFTHGGARGVGIATTTAVVVSAVVILIADYFINAVFILFDI